MPKRVPYEPGHVYFITKNTWRRQPVFFDADCVRLLLAEFDFYRHQFGYKIYAWVIMPDHYHWIIEFSSDDFERFHVDQIRRKGKYHQDTARYYISSRMESINSHAAQVINRQRHRVGIDLWQKGFHDTVIQDEQGLKAAVAYIHNNPVKAELCRQPCDYPWSSYHAILQGDNSLLRLDPLPF